MTDQQRTAFDILKGIGPLLPYSASQRCADPAVYRGLFEEDWVQNLPLPLGDERRGTQSVAFVDKNGFHRPSGEQGIAAAQELPRTRVYESIHVRSHGWAGLVTLQLMRCLRRVVICTMYESRSDDGNLGPHTDQWFGLIVQMRGVKRWSLGEVKRTEQMKPGDVLTLPPDVLHKVRTPRNPGYSVHLVFAITDRLVQ